MNWNETVLSIKEQGFHCVRVFSSSYKLTVIVLADVTPLHYQCNRDYVYLIVGCMPDTLRSLHLRTISPSFHKHIVYISTARHHSGYWSKRKYSACSLPTVADPPTIWQTVGRWRLFQTRPDRSSPLDGTLEPIYISSCALYLCFLKTITLCWAERQAF